jgi:hypothetical protein
MWLLISKEERSLTLCGSISKRLRAAGAVTVVTSPQLATSFVRCARVLTLKKRIDAKEKHGRA